MRAPSAEPSIERLSRLSNLSRAQLLMWLGQEVLPDVPLYNMVQAFRIEGKLDPAAFQRAWRAFVCRADALRTTIVLRDGVPWRTVRDEVPPALEVVDLRGTGDAEHACAAWIEERKTRRLRLDERPWDTALLRLADELSVWYLCQHHLVADARSFEIAYRQVSAAYELALEGREDEAPRLPPYEDYLDHERRFRSSQRASKAAVYWRHKLGGPHEPTLLYGRSVTGETPRTQRLVLDVGEARSARLRAVAGSPEFRCLTDELSQHALWTTLVFAFLHRTSGAHALRVGTPFLNRPTAAYRETPGLFIEIGRVDAELRPEDTFVTLGRRVQRELMDALLHAVPGASSPGLNRSYDVLVNSVNSRFGRFAGHPASADWIHTGFGDSAHALRLQITDFAANGAFRLLFDANEAVFPQDERGWLLGQFSVLLERFLDEPTRGLGSFDLLDEAERRRLAAWNASDAEYPRDATVVDLFEAQVRATPAAPAVHSKERTLTYAELDEQASRLARRLRAHGAGRGTTVAVCLPRSTRAVVAILAILKTAAAYVPVDPSYPRERRQLMIDDAEPVAVVTDGGVTDLHTSVPLVDVSETPADARAGELQAGAPRVEDLAYVIYTSGSTGRPKGTLLTHRGLVNYLWWARRQYADDQPRDFALHSSLAFDLTITSLFVPLICGGRVVVYQGSRHGEGLEVLDVFEDDAVDVVKLTPAHLALLREHGLARPGRITRLIVGGETFPTELARAVSEAFAHQVAIDNEYGPTETVVGCMVHRYQPGVDVGAAVPIGRPAANARVHVLDAYDQPVPRGVTGEMVVSGDGVALGYHRQAELTARSFGDDKTRAGARWYRTGDLARWDADGELTFLGRADAQVKIRGVRVELGEIEAALLAHPAVDGGVAHVFVPADDAARPLRHCVNCGLASNYPGADLDASGECSDCRAYARHRQDVARYFRTPDDLRALLGRVKARAAGRPHDCIVLTSGGKDSTYMLYQLVREYGVRPLAFTLDNGYISEEALTNVRGACADLGVELYVARTPHMKAIFADSLRRHANVCNGCFKTVYTLSMALARARGIDTIVTGLSRGQLFETRLADAFAAREFDPDRVDAWVAEARKAYHHIDDAVYRLLDSELFEDEAVFDRIRFVDFYRHVDVGLQEVYAYLATRTAWKRPSDTGRSTNCLINDVGIYVHRKTRGFHNYALPYGWDVRLGHKRREAAMAELEDDIDVGRVRRILKEIDYDAPLHAAGSDKRLVVYYVSRAGVSAADVRSHLAERLPAAVMPSDVVPLRELPLTVNGKVDRAALPDPRQAGDAARPASLAPPRTETERRLAAAWARVLQRPQMGVDENYFELGGDSITSIQLVAAARREGLRFSARDIFDHPTIAALAAHLDQLPADDGRAAARPPRFELTDEARERIAGDLAASGGWENVEDAYPLTPTQLGMLYHSLRSGDPRTYFGQATCVFAGPVDSAALEQAWRTVCQRHAATRARFLWSGLDTPLQVVQRSVSFPWLEHDWRGRSAEAVAGDLEALLENQRARGFDLAGPALMSFAVVQTDERTHFVWNSHHALLDGWAAHRLFDEALLEYEARVSAASSPPQEAPPFRDQIDWLRAQDAAAAAQWWREYLSGVDTPTPLPLPVPRPGSAGSGHATLARPLDPATSARIQEFTRSRRLTLSTLACGAWALLLSHYAGTDEVVFGATVSGREDGVPGVDGIVGMLITTLPVRLRIDPEGRVGEWLERAHADALEARRQGHLGLAEIQRQSRVPSAQPLFESIVVVENFPALRARETSSLRPSELQLGAPSNYALALAVHPGAPIRAEAVYDCSRFARDDVERLLGHFENALACIAGGAEGLAEVTIVGASERALLARWGAGVAVPPAGGLVHELVAAHAGSRPAATAVVGPDRSLTYGELLHRARSLAHALRALGIGRGHGVGLLTDGGALLVPGILAILEAGAAYVPVDPDLPRERLALMARETRMRALLVDGAPDRVPLGVSEAGGDQPAPVIIDLRHVSSDGQPDEPCADPPTAEDLAYVIYTSGSTGTPKGVMVTHANIAHSTSARFAFYGEPVGSFLLLSSLAFDSSLVGLFWTLCSGGTLVLSEPSRRHDVRHLGAEIERHRVTHLLALPSLYALLLSEAASERLSSLRTAIVAGEACPAALVAAHRAQCPAAALYNEYGPTEGTVWSHAFRVPADFEGATVPIGVPIPNSRCRVLDHLAQPAPVGIPGELVIAGPGVAAGYLQQPELTARAFVDLEALDPGGSDGTASSARERHYRTGDLVRWTAGGTLEFLGRRDRQVKLRGHRIELDEIERVLVAQPGVRAAAVVVSGDSRADADRRRLVACYCADEGLEEAALREAVAARLPRFMVPSGWVRLAEMPLTSTGKLDRQSLVAAAERPEPAAAPSRPPADPLERLLHDAWTRILGRSDIGVDQSFFDLGGNSLDAMRLFALIQRETGRNPRLSTLFEAPTIASLATALRATDEAARAVVPTAASPVVVIRRGGSRPPLFCIHGAGGNVLVFRELALGLAEEQPVYGLEARGVDGVSPPSPSIEAMAALYEEALRAVRPHGPYRIAGYSGGGVVALEVARRLAASAHHVSRVILLDTHHPALEPRRLRLADHLAALRSDGASYLPRRAAAKAGWLWRTLRDNLRLRYHERRDGPLPFELRDGTLVRHFGESVRRFTPRPYGGRVTLFRVSEQSRVFSHLGPRLGWEPDLLPGLDVIEVPGDHDTVFRQPAIGIVAARVAELLEADSRTH